MRTQWLKTRRQFLARIKRQVHGRLGSAPPDLDAYVRRYNAEFARPWKKSSFLQLQKAVKDADVILGADFHAFSQSQRIHLRILRELPETRDVILALEALSVEDQVHIDRFMAGHLDQKKFLRAVRWEQAWGFPFENYAPLFELAKARGFKVVGLSRKTTKNKRAAALPKRDQFSAEVINRWRERNPDSLVYVIIGDLHLASRHLPAAIEKRFHQGQRVLTILQNSEHLYFRLAKSGQEHSVDVMRAKGGRFCVLGSPPWVKWQSYLMYLEHTYDRDVDAPDLDFTDYVASYAIFIARDLGVEIGMEDMAVFTPNQPAAWRRLLKKLNRPEQRMAKALLQNDRSFFVPQASVLFLTRASVNHAATLAGQFVHAALGDRRATTWNFPSQFEAQIWIEAIGFFSSKLINHKRKSAQLAELKMQLNASGPARRSREVLRLALAQRLSELTGQARRFRPGQKESYLEAARIVGHMLGDRLYEAIANQRLSMAQLVSYLQIDPSRDDFASLYKEWVRSLDQALQGEKS